MATAQASRPWSTTGYRSTHWNARSSHRATGSNHPQRCGYGSANGDRFTVKSVGSQEILVADGKREVRLPVDRPLHVDYAYASTVHSAQGLTSKNVMYEADSRSPTTTREVFYVAISRAKERASIYTNDATRLPASVARATQKHSALELTRGVAGHAAVGLRPDGTSDVPRPE